jgi:hypothetical protein
MHIRKNLFYSFKKKTIFPRKFYKIFHYIIIFTFWVKSSESSCFMLRKLNLFYEGLDEFEIFYRFKVFLTKTKNVSFGLPAAGI